MTDKEKILAEIEKWRDGIKKGILTIPLTGKDRADSTFEYEILGKVQDFINSLPKEPISKDLEEAASMHYRDVMEHEMKTGLKPANMTSFKAGAQWKNEKFIEKACEWLKENAGDYVVHHWNETTLDTMSLIEDFKMYLKE